MKHVRGFTLIEVLIVTGITGLILVALVQLLVKYDTVFGTQETAIDVDTSAQELMSQAHQAILQADAIVTSHSFSGTSYSSETSTIVLQLPSVDSSGNIVSGSYDYVGIYATGTDAYEITDAAASSNRIGGPILLSDVLSTLTFTYSTTTLANATSTLVDVVTAATSSTIWISRHLHEQTYLRNI